MDKIIRYQVHDSPEKCFIRVSEKASYLNCGPLREFINDRYSSGQTNFVVDFEDCLSLDSTFLGMLVSLALKVKGNGSLSLINLRNRNLETVQNLGIHKIAIVSSERYEDLLNLSDINSNELDDKCSQETILDAHRSLIELNKKNQKMFCDVVKFMERRLQEDS